MNLRIGTYTGCYNNILIAASDSSLGSNQDTNSVAPADAQLPSTDGQPSPPLELVNHLPQVAIDGDRSDDDVHREENNSLMLGIAFMGGLGALIYLLVFR